MRSTFNTVYLAGGEAITGIDGGAGHPSSPVARAWRPPERRTIYQCRTGWDERGVPPKGGRRQTEAFMSRGSFSVALLLSIPFVGLLSNAMLVPVLPKIAAALDVPYHQVSWLIVVPSIVAAVVIPIGGYLSDRWTRTVVLAPSLLLYGAGGLLGALSPLLMADPFPLLLAARFVQGIGYAGTIVLVIALAGDMWEPDRRSRVLGLIETSNALGKASGPLIGAALGSLTWYAPFFVFPVLAIPLGVMLWRHLGRLPHPDEPRPTLSAFARRVWHAIRPRLRALAAIFLAGFWGVNVILLLLTLLSRDLADAGWRALPRGIAITVPELAVGTSAWAAGRFLQDDLAAAGPFVVLGGMLLMALAFVLAALASGLWALATAAVVAGAGAGAVLAGCNVLLSGAVSDEERGVVASTYGAFRASGVAIIPLFFAFSAGIGGERAALWLVSGGIAATAVVAARCLMPFRQFAAKTREKE